MAESDVLALKRTVNVCLERFSSRCWSFARWRSPERFSSKFFQTRLAVPSRTNSKPSLVILITKRGRRKLTTGKRPSTAAESTGPKITRVTYRRAAQRIQRLRDQTHEIHRGCSGPALHRLHHHTHSFGVGNADIWLSVLQRRRSGGVIP